MSSAVLSRSRESEGDPTKLGEVRGYGGAIDVRASVPSSPRWRGSLLLPLAGEDVEALYGD